MNLEITSFFLNQTKTSNDKQKARDSLHSIGFRNSNLEFEISNKPNTPHASEKHEKTDEEKRSKSRKDRNVESDLNSLVKISAGLRLPEM
jgi:hypothetical protein